MAEAFVYDHLRTPRGKGKTVGSLHEVKPVDLVVGLLDEIQARNPVARPDRVDDVVLGVVSPDRRPGRRHRQDRGARGRLPRDRRRRPAQPLLRLRPRGRQPGRGAGPRRLRGPDPRRRRRVDEPGADGLRRRRLGDGPGHRADHRLRAAGHRRRPDRHARGLEPRRRRRVRRRVAPPRRQGLGQRLLRRRRRPGQGPQRPDRARPRRAHPPRHHASRAWPGSSRRFADDRRAGAGFDDVALEKYHWVERDRPRPPRRQLLGHRRRRRARGDRHRAGRHRPRPHPARPDRRRPRSPAPTRRSC